MPLKNILLTMLFLSYIILAHETEVAAGDICGSITTKGEESISFAGALIYLLLVVMGISIFVYGFKYATNEKWKKDFIAAGSILVIAVIITYFLGPGLNLDTMLFGPVGSQHVHSDIRVVLDGHQLDLSQDKYISSSSHSRSSIVHLHDNNGNVIHIHVTGVTLGYFFKTLGMQLTSNCFQTDNGQKYCNNGTKSLNVFVNGKPVDSPNSYVMQDLDKILVYYGEKNNATSQLPLVTNESCIQSKKCPVPQGYGLDIECATS